MSGGALVVNILSSLAKHERHSLLVEICCGIIWYAECTLGVKKQRSYSICACVLPLPSHQTKLEEDDSRKSTHQVGAVDRVAKRIQFTHARCFGLPV